MAGEQYGSVGAAFSGTLDKFLITQEAQRHQALLDSIAQKREDRLAEADRLDNEIRREELKQKQTEAILKEKDRVLGDHLKKRGQLVPGDIPSKQMVDEGTSLGIPLRLGASPTIPAGQSQVQMPGGPATMPGAQPSQSFPESRPYLGSRSDEAFAELIKTLPADSPERRGLEYEQATGRNAPAGIFKMAGADTEAVLRQNPRNGKIDRLVNGDWIPLTGEPPKGAHWMTEKDPAAESGGQPHFQLQPELDATGKPTGHYFGYNTKTNSFTPVQGPQPQTTKAPPGATAAAQKAVSIETGKSATSRLKKDLDDADAMGLIGPASGRFYQLLAKGGSTGDPKKDELIGRLKGDILLTKMHVDAGIGGTRAASSPLLLKNWEDLALSGSKALMMGYVNAIESDMGGPSGGATTPPPPGAAAATKPSTRDLIKKARQQ